MPPLGFCVKVNTDFVLHYGDGCFENQIPLARGQWLLRAKTAIEGMARRRKLLLDPPREVPEIPRNLAVFAPSIIRMVRRK